MKSRSPATRFLPISGGAASRLRCERHVVSTPAAIRDLRHLTRAFLEITGAGEDAVAALEVVVGEALANVHCHAYRGDTGPIDFLLEVEGAELTCVIRDRGHAPADLKVPVGLPEPLGGFGLFIMAKLMDEVEISHPEGKEHGTLVRMRKALGTLETHTC